MKGRERTYIGTVLVASLVASTPTRRDRENLARFGITASKAFGLSMTNMQVLAKRLGRNHELAAALWDTGGAHVDVVR